jgi:hypothetical protein
MFSTDAEETGIARTPGTTIRLWRLGVFEAVKKSGMVPRAWAMAVENVGFVWALWDSPRFFLGVFAFWRSKTPLGFINLANFQKTKGGEPL